MKKYLSLLLAAFFLSLSIPAFSSAVTDDEIDKFLNSIPVTSDLLDTIKAKVDKNEPLAKKLAKAQLDGKYMREMMGEIEAWPEYSALESLVKQTGFENIEKWSLTVDRVFGVVSSAQWVVLVAAMPMPNSDTAPVLKRDTNIFEFLSDEKNDPKLREKYGKQLEEMCAKMCYDTADLNVVGARYSEIESVIKKQKKSK
jgi:hypothetical protein